ncbi:MAG: phosphatidylglycerol lysyltransferase domain-containing protein [Lachnospiraceae bacterium]|nr:phosphatidylglycerol lysyltransferase domain-containing protein [Lachnospiraceae bacterium]
MKNYEFKRPMMEDKEQIDFYFKSAPSRSCERTFDNVFLWAKAYGVEYAIIENTLVFKSPKEETTCAFSYPAGEAQNVKNAIEALMKFSEEQGYPFCLYNVTNEHFEQLEGWYPGRFEIEYNRDIADYVYESEKLITLAGKKLHGKRNHINKFMATFDDWKYETLSDDNLEACFQMALKWRIENGCEDDEEKNTEMCVTLNSLRLYKELGLKGGILRVNGEIVAFTMGEPLCEDTFVVHIEKAFPDVQGAYPMINQQFIEHECAEFKYINREEDTGSEGLRKAKLSYRPVFLVEKGIVKEIDK